MEQAAHESPVCVNQVVALGQTAKILHCSRSCLYPILAVGCLVTETVDLLLLCSWQRVEMHALHVAEVHLAQSLVNLNLPGGEAKGEV